MSIPIKVLWVTLHNIEAPADVDELGFAKKLEEGDPDAWEFALEQVDASTADLYDWETA